MQVGYLAAALIGLTALPLAAQDTEHCRHEAQRSANVEADGVRRLVVGAGSGSLTIEGKPGLTTVRIRGRACASSADLLDAIRLNARRDGSDIIVEANKRDDNRGWNYEGNQYARLDVIMEVPARMAADIEDGSGSITLSELGAVEIDDGSGEIVGDNLHGDVRVHDGSGEIRFADVAGRVNIEDGSGEIELRNIGGPIDIDDGSGEIDIRGARNSVRISDASGSIGVVDVAGDFVVEDDGSGGIDYGNVRGRVDIPRKKR
jgi:hypothetical protein